ncbi:MAG TPA: hypothetical protein VGG61_08550 [Gemmataceae bacterium]|jgi:hypothetical protein
MFRKLVPSGLLLASVFFVVAGQASAARTPTVRNPGVYTPGVRADKFVPFLTTGNQTVFSTTVSPIILTGPRINDPAFPPVAAPIYNLPFYGAIQGFGNSFNAVTPRLGSDAIPLWTPTKTRVKLNLPTIY